MENTPLFARSGDEPVVTLNKNSIRLYCHSISIFKLLLSKGLKKPFLANFCSVSIAMQKDKFKKHRNSLCHCLGLLIVIAKLYYFVSYNLTAINGLKIIRKRLFKNTYFIDYLKTIIQGVHKVSLQFKKIITK